MGSGKHLFCFVFGTMNEWGRADVGVGGRQPRLRLIRSSRNAREDL